MRGQSAAMTILLLLLLTFTAGTAWSSEEALGDLEAFIQREMQEQKIPGMSIAVMHGDLFWARGFGFADLENQVPAKAESSYRMASVTKPMTAVGILELVEQGKIDLDAEVHTYLPWFPEKPHPITVRQILGHLGGISHYQNYDAEGHFREPMNTREAIAVFADFDLVAEPGTRYQYSSYGYNLLGAILEAASGQSYGAFMTSTVWKPLGMTDTRMDDPRAIIPNRVEGYTLEGGELRRSEYVDISSRFAAGGTRSTVVDMVAFVRELASGKILEPDSRELMWTSLETVDGIETNYGLGWGVRPLSGRFRVNHSGSQQETRTLLRYLPRENFAVAIASNLEQGDLYRFADKITEELVGELYDANVYAGTERYRHILRTLEATFHSGLAYHDRHGRPLTDDPGELRDSFAYFERAIDAAGKEEGEALSREGAHPKGERAFTVVGSWMAHELAKRDRKLLDSVRGNGPLALLDAYTAIESSEPALDEEIAALVAHWTEEWNEAGWEDFADVRFARAEDLDRHSEALRATAGRTLRPDFLLDLVRLAESSAESGDFETAMRTGKLAVDVYPEHDASTGLYGILLFMAGDEKAGEALIRKSVAIRKDGYAGPQSLSEIAGFLREAGQDEQALALLNLGAELHPDSKELLALPES